MKNSSLPLQLIPLVLVVLLVTACGDERTTSSPGRLGRVVVADGEEGRVTVVDLEHGEILSVLDLESPAHLHAGPAKRFACRVRSRPVTAAVGSTPT